MDSMMREEYAALKLGDFSEEEVAVVEELITTINLNNPVSFSSWGSVSDGADAIDEVSGAIEGSPVSRLSAKLAEIVESMRTADPRILAKKPNWLSRKLGFAVEARVKYKVARKSIDEDIQEATAFEGDVRDALEKMSSMLASHRERSNTIRFHLAAGHLYLSRNPDAGRPDQAEMIFEDNRARFSRRLANLATLLTSHGMTEVQLRLGRSSGFDMLDRFVQLTQVLVPVWRQHTLSLISATHEDPELVAAASRAHDALMAGLASSVNGDHTSH
nr:hypothetical protein [Burkholderia sp. M701]